MATIDPDKILMPGEERVIDDIITTVPQQQIVPDFTNFNKSLEKNNIIENPLPPYGGNIIIPNIDYDSYAKYLKHDDGTPMRFSFITDDPDDLRAYKQSTGEKWLYFLPKTVTRIGTNVVGATVGLLYGGANYLANISKIGEGGMLKSFWDNDFNRSLDSINEWMDEKLPHYYTKEEQQYGLWRSMGTANFWANDFSQGFSFVAGAVLSEYLSAGFASSAIVSRATQLMSKTGRAAGITRGSKYLDEGKTVIQGLNKADDLLKRLRTKNALVTLRQLGTGAMYEAGVEARHHYDATVQKLVKAHVTRTGKEPSTSEMANIVDIATKMANGVWAGNVALVGYSNYMMFPKIFGKGFNGSRRSLKGVLKEEVKDGVKKYKTLYKEAGKFRSTVRNAWRILKTPLYEGFVEEGGQRLLDVSGQMAAEHYYLSKTDPTHMGLVEELILSTYDSFSEAYGSAQGQKEIGLGFILAALGLPGYSKSSTKGKEGKRKFQMIGGIFGKNGYLQQAREHDKAIDDLATLFEKEPDLVSALQRKMDTLVREGSLEDLKDFAMAIDSPFLYKSAEHDQIFNHIINKLRGGFESSLLDDIEIVRNMSIEEFRSTFKYNELDDLNDEQLLRKQGEVADMLQKRVEVVKETWNKVNSSFINFGPDQKAMVAHALSVSKDSDQRESDLIAEIEKIVGFPLEIDRVTVKGEEVRNKRTKDQNAQSGLIDRLGKIWSRITPSQKQKIMALPEAREYLQGKNIREFTDPSHIEELVGIISEKSVQLQAQLDELEKLDQDGSPLAKTDAHLNKKTALAKEIKKLNERAQLLFDSIGQALDPDISASEQKILDQWKEENPTAYETEHKDVIQKIKDLRNIRARRHRALDMVNQLTGEHDSSLREDGSWSERGKVIPRPEMLLMKRKGIQDDLGDNIKDENLKRIYYRYRGKVIEFTYKTTGLTSESMYIEHAIDNNIYESALEIVQTLMQTGEWKVQEAWESALRQKGVPFKKDEGPKTYRVWVDPRDGKDVTDKSEILVNYPSETIQRLLIKKDRLSYLAGKGNKEAKKQIESIDAQLKHLEPNTKYRAFKLDFLNRASQIKEVTPTQKIKEQIQTAVNATKEDLLDDIKQTNTGLDKIITDLVKQTEILQKWESAKLGTPMKGVSKWKKDVNNKPYVTIDGTNYSENGINKKLNEIREMFNNLEVQKDTLEIQLSSLEYSLRSLFPEIQSRVLEAKDKQEYSEIINSYIEQRWEGDKALFLELRNSKVFEENPALKSIWELMADPEAESLDTQFVDQLVKFLKGQGAIPQQLLDHLYSEKQELQDKYEAALRAKQKMEENFFTTTRITRPDGSSFEASNLNVNKKTRKEYQKLLKEIDAIKLILDPYRDLTGLAKQRLKGLEHTEELQKLANRQIARDTYNGLRDSFIINLHRTLATIKRLQSKPLSKKEQEKTKEEEVLNTLEGASTPFETEEMLSQQDLSKYKVEFNSSPITINELSVTAGAHEQSQYERTELERLKKTTIAANPEQDPKKGPVWTQEQENALLHSISQTRFFNFTQNLNTHRRSEKDKYRLVFLHRGNVINFEEKWAEKILFYDQISKGKFNSTYRKASDINKRHKELVDESLEDIKVVLVSSRSLKPILDKDNTPIYTNLRSSKVTKTIKGKGGQNVEVYRYGLMDLQGTVKDGAIQEILTVNNKKVYIGQLTSTAQKILDNHIKFREDLLSISEVKKVKISGKSKGILVWPTRDRDHREVAGKTVVQNEEQVKDIDIRVNTFKNGIIDFGEKRIQSKPGAVYINKNSNFIEVPVNMLPEWHVNNVYNILRLYANNRIVGQEQGYVVNGKQIRLDGQQAAMAAKIDFQGNVEILGDKTLQQYIKDVLYYGSHAKDRKNPEHAIYIENDELFFGTNSMSLSQLANKEVNFDLHEALKTFLRNRHFNVNNVVLKKDIDKRKERNSKISGAYAKWETERKRKSWGGKWTKGAIVNLENKVNNAVEGSKTRKEAEKKLQAAKNKRNTFYLKNANPYNRMPSVKYDPYNELIVNDDLEPSIQEWSNYTEYLLSLKNNRTEDQVPIKLNMQIDYSGNTGIDESTTPQIWQSNLLYTKAAVSNLDNLEDMSSEDAAAEEAATSAEAEIVGGTSEQMAIGERYEYTHHMPNADHEFHLSVLDFTITEINDEAGTVSFDLHSFTDAKGENLDTSGIEKNKEKWEEAFFQFRQGPQFEEHFSLQTASETVTDEVLEEEEAALETDTTTEYDEANMKDITDLKPKASRQRKTTEKRSLEESDEKGPINDEMNKKRDDLENCD